MKDFFDDRGTNMKQKIHQRPPKMHEIRLQNNENAENGLMYILAKSLVWNGQPQVPELSSKIAQACSWKITKGWKPKAQCKNDLP